MEDGLLFNSSDMDLSDAEQDSTYKSLGQQSLGKMMNNHFELRKSTKIAAKKVMNTLVIGAPSTLKNRNRWMNLWDAFVANVLQKPTTEPPVAEDLCRFLLAAPEFLTSMRTSGQFSHQYFKNAMVSLLETLSFRFGQDRFNLDKRARLQIENTFSTLRKKGALTKEPMREKKWISDLATFRLVCALMSDALVNGTASWDKTIAQALSITIQTALITRGGDVMLTSGYTVEYMKYQDVVLTLVPRAQTGDEQLTAYFIIKHAKEFK
ncbi:MAG: hypothetical protein Q9180_006411 [Flavoplaca navasiana]